MRTTTTSPIAGKSAFAWVAAGSAALLLIPFVAMQFTQEVDWSTGDFLVMGTLLFVTGSTFVFVARKVDRRRWWLVGVLSAAAFLYVWAELAVGVFTNLGS